LLLVLGRALLPRLRAIPKTQPLTLLFSKADSSGDELFAASLTDAGYAATLIDALWLLEPQSEIWKAAAAAGFYYFRWENDCTIEHVDQWLEHVRTRAQLVQPEKQIRKAAAGQADEVCCSPPLPPFLTS
jgi:hypothetical protein